MGIGSVTSMNGMSSLQTTMAGSTDVKSKNIQNEITDIQQQMQKLSSQEELSVDEKADERKKLQREVSSLNAELERHQEEFLRSQKRELMMAELRMDAESDEEKSAGRMRTDEADKEDTAEKDTKATDTDNVALSRKETSSVASADKPTQQTGNQGTFIAKNSDGIVILKGEMDQDTKRNVGADETNEEDSAEEETNGADTRLSHKEMHAMVSADASVQQAGIQGTVIARISGGIAILKGEMNLDEKRGEDTEKKQAELEKMEEREEKARNFQFSVLGEANNAMRSAAKDEVPGKQVDTENNAFINASKLSQEEAQASWQRFNVSFG